MKNVKDLVETLKKHRRKARSIDTLYCGINTSAKQLDADIYSHLVNDKEYQMSYFKNAIENVKRGADKDGVELTADLITGYMFGLKGNQDGK